MTEYSESEYYFSRAYLLSPETRLRCMQNLLKFPTFNFYDDAEPLQEAAVLIALCCDKGRMSMLYTVRSPQLRSFSGQVAFPGGKCDPSDENVVDTALRETEEELGIAKTLVDVWGIGTYMTTMTTKIAIYPVIGFIKDFNFDDMRPSLDEVEQVFTLPLEHLCNPENVEITNHSGKMLLPCYLGGPKKIWGITAVLTHTFLQSLFPKHIYRTDLLLHKISNL